MKKFIVAFLMVFMTTQLHSAEPIQFARGSAAAWNGSSRILLSGEPGVETDTGKLKIGNGTSLWSALPYAASVWFSGSGAPSVGTGGNGDFYFRTDTDDVYKKTSGSWGSPIANLKGSTGTTGATGATGSTGPTGPNQITSSTATTFAAGTILASNGTTIRSGVAGTDYLTPTGNGSSLTGITASQVGAASTGHTQAWGTITGTPTNLSGYGITDAYTKTASDARYPITHTVSGGTYVVAPSNFYIGTLDPGAIAATDVWIDTSGEVGGVSPSAIACTGTDKVSAYNATTGVFTCTADQTSGGGTGITSLGGLSASSQTFVNDTNVTMTSATSTHTLGWTGTLADGRIASAATWNAKQTGDADLTAIAVLAGTSGLLKKTAADTWSLDTNTYLTTTGSGASLTGLTASQVGNGTAQWNANQLQGTGVTSGAPTTNDLLQYTGASWDHVAPATVKTSLSLTKTDVGLANVLNVAQEPAAGNPGADGYCWKSTAAGVRSWGTCSAGGGGDASTNTSTSVDSEVALFSGTGGKTLKRATGTGFLKVTSGVASVDSSTYLTGNQTVTLSGDATGSGATAITVAVGKINGVAVDSAVLTTGDFLRYDGTQWRHAALVSGDVPSNAANTSGTAANLSGTPTLPNGTAATTQAVDDSTTKLATTAYVIGQASAAGDGTPAAAGTAARGTTTHFARADHVHPSQTTITGNAGTATALAANGSNCAPGSYPLGTDASGASESCTALPTFPSGAIVGITDTQGLSNKTLVNPTVNGVTYGQTASTTFDTNAFTGATLTTTGAITVTITNVSVGKYFDFKISSSGGGAITIATLTPTWVTGTPASITTGKSSWFVCKGSGTNTADCAAVKENF